MNFDKVTRLEVIDHTPCPGCDGQRWVNTSATERHECRICGGAGFVGRELVKWNPDHKIELSLQDDGKTLKIFISEREKDGTM